MTNTDLIERLKAADEYNRAHYEPDPLHLEAAAALTEANAKLGERGSIYVVAFALSKRDGSTTTYSMSMHWTEARSEEEAYGKALVALPDLKPGFSVWEKLICGPFTRATLAELEDRR